MQARLLCILQENYDAKFTDHIYSLPEISAQDVKRKARSDLSEVRVTYTNKSQFKEIAKVLGIMDDFRVNRAFLHITYVPSLIPQERKFPVGM